jgi:hypothetical protein
MRKIWNGLARVLAVLVAVVLVAAAVLALFLTGVERRLTNPATYKAILNGQQVYSRLPRVLAEQIVMQATYNPCASNPLLCENASQEFLDCALDKLGQDRFDLLRGGVQTLTDVEREHLQPCIQNFGANLQEDTPGGPPTFLKALGIPEWELIISKLFPPEELRMTVEELLDQFFAFLKENRENVVLNLAPFKSRLTGQSGLDAVIQVLKNQPRCTPESYEQMTASLEGRGMEIVLCSPTNEQLQPLVPLIQRQLFNLADSFPDVRVLLDAESGENTNQSGPLGTGPRESLHSLRLMMRLSPLLPLGLLLLITLLVVRSPRSWLRWWGIPFLISGLAALLTVALTQAINDQLWLAYLAERIPPYISLGAVTLVQDLVRGLMRALLGGMTVSAILLGVLGLGMFIGSLFIKPRPEPAAENAA